MNTILRNAQREIARLKEKDEINGLVQVDINLNFDFGEEAMKATKGYEAFAEALESLGGKHTEKNIQKACEISGFHRCDVSFDDVEPYIYTISTMCTKKVAKAFENTQKYKNQIHSFN